MGEIVVPMDDGSSAHLLVASGPFRLTVGATTWLFDFSEHSGPVVVGRRGEPVAQPGPRSPFWRAVTFWAQQGRQVRPDGLCIWREVDEYDGYDLVAIGRRKFLVRTQKDPAHD